MSIPETQEAQDFPLETQDQPAAASSTEAGEDFSQLLKEFEQSHASKPTGAGSQIRGTVAAVTADAVLVDIGFKTEGMLPLAALGTTTVKPGDTMLVSVKGRNEEGYYDIVLQKVEQPKDWSALEKAFLDQSIILGNVTGVVKGGLTVDVGVRAFLPASRSGARDAAEMEKLVGQEIRCRILKLEVDDEDVVVDRRAVLEQEQQAVRAQRYGEMKEGDTVAATVRSLTEYGAFVDLGGVDALLHISDMAWNRVSKPGDVVSVGQQVDVKILKIDGDKRRLSVGMKQLLPQPWESVSERYKVGDRVHGTISRVADFGAFVELEPGIEGMVHLSEMSWAKKVRKASDMLKEGERVEAVVLGIQVPERRISLGIKQTLGDPWVEVSQKYTSGSVIEGPIVSFTKFGAFVQIAEGVEGMIHVSEISADKRIEHPQDVLKKGQVVQAQIIDFDKEKRQIRLSMKRLVPTSLDEYLAEHKAGDTVTARIMTIENGVARVELGEGIYGSCQITSAAPLETESSSSAKPDLSALSSMLKARWKGNIPAATPTMAVAAGQIRSFRLASIDPASKKIELTLE
jgi:small subunit ribosomal protein S1